jgi:hypothetical protein
MIPFIQLRQKRLETLAAQSEVGPRTTAIVLALILCFQIGLLVLVLLKNWSS